MASRTYLPNRITRPSSSGSTRKKPEKPHSATAASAISSDAAAAEIAARQHGAQLVLAAAQQFLEIGRRRARRRGTRAPRPLGTRTPGTAAALIAPRHHMPSAWPILADSLEFSCLGQGYRGRNRPFQRAPMPRLTRPAPDNARRGAPVSGAISRFRAAFIDRRALQAQSPVRHIRYGRSDQRCASDSSVTRHRLS